MEKKVDKGPCLELYESLEKLVHRGPVILAFSKLPVIG